MPELAIELPEGRRALRPGERLCGRATWDAPGPARIELLWTTRGRGDADSATVAQQDLAVPGDFAFELPASPWSFSGKLVSLRWRLRLVLASGLETSQEIILSPKDAAVNLHGDLPV